MSLPAGAYLGWRYHDAHQQVSHGRVYWDDGRIDSVEGDARTEVCRLDADQLLEARDAVAAAFGPPPEHEAIGRAAPGHDAASVVYAWRVDGQGGQFRYDYPPEPPAVARLEARLADLEEAAGGWPLMADE